jgi:D-3-phosphoglycerate dehydrogenase
VESYQRIANEVQGTIQRYIDNGSTFGSINFPSVVAWPLRKTATRILVIHRNVRGILREMLNILSDHNVEKQIWESKDGVGYLIVDVRGDRIPADITINLASLANTIRMRILSSE